MGTTANVLVGIAQVVVTPITGGPAAPVTIGYTTDGVTMTIRSDFANVKVEENVGTIIRKLTDQEIEVTLNMAEGDLNNLVMAIPGSSKLGSVITLGGEELQEYKMEITGIKPGPVPAGRVITLNNVNPVGEVGIPFKKGEVSVVPVTFAALVADTGKFGDIDDS